MNYKFTESVVEEACLQYFGQLDYQYLSAPEIACDGVFAERADYGDTILKQRLRAALVKINPAVPAPAIEEAVRKVTRTESPTLVINNREGGIRVWVKTNPKELSSDISFVRDVSKIGHWGVGDVELTVNSLERLRDGEVFVRKSFEKVTQR